MTHRQPKENHECHNSEPLASQVVDKIPERDISKLLKSMGDGFVIVCKGLAIAAVIAALGFSAYLTYSLVKDHDSFSIPTKEGSYLY